MESRGVRDRVEVGAEEEEEDQKPRPAAHVGGQDRLWTNVPTEWSLLGRSKQKAPAELHNYYRLEFENKRFKFLPEGHEQSPSGKIGTYSPKISTRCQKGHATSCTETTACRA